MSKWQLLPPHILTDHTAYQQSDTDEHTMSIGRCSRFVRGKRQGDLHQVGSWACPRDGLNLRDQRDIHCLDKCITSKQFSSQGV